MVIVSSSDLASGDRMGCVWPAIEQTVVDKAAQARATLYVSFASASDVPNEATFHDPPLAYCDPHQECGGTKTHFVRRLGIVDHQDAHATEPSIRLRQTLQQERKWDRPTLEPGYHA